MYQNDLKATIQENERVLLERKKKSIYFTSLCLQLRGLVGVEIQRDESLLYHLKVAATGTFNAISA